MNDGWYKARTLAAKRLADFIRSRPDGATFKDIKAAGLTTWGLDRLTKLGIVHTEQVREPERGPRAFHFLWKASRNFPAQVENWRCDAQEKTTTFVPPELDKPGRGAVGCGT